MRQFDTVESGDYEFAYLLPGPYRIEVEATGISRFVRDRVVVDAARQIRVDATLSLGSVSESITVTGDTTPLLETDTAALNDSRDERLYRSLPTAQGQEPFNLLANMPNFQSANTKYRFTVGGAGTGQSEFQQDSISVPNNNNPELSASMTMEGVREVKLMALNNSAEFGLPGIYQTVTKSGGNEFHGSG